MSCPRPPGSKRAACRRLTWRGAVAIIPPPPAPPVDGAGAARAVAVAGRRVAGDGPWPPAATNRARAIATTPSIDAAAALGPRLRLFGTPEVLAGGDSAGGARALPFERRSQLLVHLALRRAWVPRAELAALLWPGQAEALAYANLRKTLFRLQGLPWGRGIEVQGSLLRCLAPTDVQDFEAALRERRLADLLALRRGELLVGFDDGRSEAWTGWLQLERERLRSAWRGALLQHLAQDPGAEEGIEVSARLLADDPLDEEAMRAHMQALAQGGQTARARQVYREFGERLRRELDLAPAAASTALHERLATGAAVPLAPPGPSAADDGFFVGRVAERQEAARRLAQPDCRLLCLVGPGGVGKTRLAQRLLLELGPDHADGGCFVALDDVAAVGELPARIAAALALPLPGGRDPLAQLTAALRPRRMLIVLDNFEQLAADAGLLARLVADAPGLHLVVTSRVRLTVAGAWTLPLEGLPTPEPEDQDRIADFDAVRLFVDAARRAGGAPDPVADAPAITEICRRVDGLPLALEMAAAWTRTLPCAAIATDLERGAELLRAIDPARPSRHASVEAVFEGSWRLLGSAERETLARLSVFRGGFGVEAARAVTGAALPVLAALVDKSLLRRQRERLALHPLLHQLAAERLAPGTARDEVERAHARHFLRGLAGLGPAVATGDAEALRAVDADWDNVRAAWRHAVARRDAAALAGGVLTVLHHGDHRGRFRETLELLREALPLRAGANDHGLQPLLAGAIAHLTYHLDRYDDALAIATPALAAMRGARDHEARLQCHKVLAACALRQGRHGDARRHFRQALQLARSGGDARQAAAMLDNLAQVEKAVGRLDDALRLATQALVEHRRAGVAAGEALCLNNLGALLVDRDELAGARGENLAAAREHLAAALALSVRHQLVATRALVLSNLAGVALKSGALSEAEDHARQALELTLASGQQGLLCWLRLRLAELALHRGDLARARTELAAAMEVALSIGHGAMQIDGVAVFARLLDAQGEAAAAARMLRQAIVHPGSTALHRGLLQSRLDQLDVPAPDASGWDGPTLDELMRRIVVEAASGHAALIAALRGARS